MVHFKLLKKLAWLLQKTWIRRNEDQGGEASYKATETVLWKWLRLRLEVQWRWKEMDSSVSWAQGMQDHSHLLLGHVGQYSYIYSREKTEWSKVQFIGEKARVSYALNTFATPLPTNSQRIRPKDSNFIQDNHCFVNYLLNSIICFPIQIPHSAILVQGVPNQFLLLR